ncbi:site-specific integrase [Blastococcus sp. BMG 814]|uniref:Site-specific integrase n=1 Tax=Blastococcus carthaginiensis TaxID=3050034 RepID=A0ABT9ICF3_9ACTN|nr:site-specific integrase [Blastococcus carthaginiensis]MDP5183251.1 site-specific integrase [Blastococcus carthaginiensis]
MTTGALRVIETILNDYTPTTTTADIEGAIDYNVLAGFGTYDDATAVFVPDLNHSVFKTNICDLDGCSRIRRHPPYCTTHRERWVKAGKPDDPEHWIGLEVAGMRAVTVPKELPLCLICRVPDHERPAMNDKPFCLTHHSGWMRARKTSTCYDDPQVFVAERAPLTSRRGGPLPTMPPCALCGGQGYRGWGERTPGTNAAARALCVHHFHAAYHLRSHKGYDYGEALAELHRRATDKNYSNELHLGFLSPRVRSQVLILFLHLLTNGYKNPHGDVVELLNILRHTPVTDIMLLSDHVVARGSRRMAALAKRVLRRHFATPQAERTKPVWDLSVWGKSGASAGYLNFARITQPWLREAVQTYVYDFVDTKALDTLRAWLDAFNNLSASLRLRSAEGNDFTMLDREDIHNLLRFMESRRVMGSMSGSRRWAQLGHIKMLLDELQDRHQGGQLRSQGLRPAFRLHRKDIPSRPKKPRSEVGKALPPEVMSFLLTPENLDRAVPMFQRLFRLEAAVGRRPSELSSLPLDCLVEEDGVPKLRVDMPKVHIVGYLIPLAGEEDAITAIREQQQIVRRDFPHTPINDLALWPSPMLNPNGTVPVSPTWFRVAMGLWLRSLPPIPAPEQIRSGYATPDIPTKPDGQDDDEVIDEEEARDNSGSDDEEDAADAADLVADGQASGGANVSLLDLDRRERAENPRVRTFPKHKVFPYALRHTYAQTHADAGTDPHVLQELMGHETVATTMIYYRLPMERKIEATARVAALTAVNWYGRRYAVGPGVDLSAEDAKALMRAQVVPHGYCAEPSVLASGARACPAGFACGPCRHFSTDAGHLPELYEHWNRLIESREHVLGPESPFATEDMRRLRAQVIQAEANAVFDLIEQCQDAVRRLPEEEAQTVLMAIQDLRRQRREFSRLIPDNVRTVVRLDITDVQPFVRGAGTGYEGLEREMKRRTTGVVK